MANLASVNVIGDMQVGYVQSYLGYVEDEQTRHAGSNDHQHSQHIRSIDEVVYSQHKTERCSNTNEDHHNVHGDTDKPRVVDVEILDVPALVGQKQTKDNQQSLVDIESSNEITIVHALTKFQLSNGIIIIVVLQW